jgi:Transposase
MAIVAQALEPGIVLFDVARRHDISPSQLLGWLKRRHLIANCERLGNRYPALRTFIVAALNSSGGDPIMKLTGRDHHHPGQSLKLPLGSGSAARFPPTSRCRRSA